MGAVVLILPALVVGSCTARPPATPTSSSLVGSLHAGSEPTPVGHGASLVVTHPAGVPTTQGTSADTAPLTMIPAPETAQHPVFAPITDPVVDPGRVMDPAADPLTVAAGFAQAWWHVDTAATDDWAPRIGPLTTGDLQSRLRDFKPSDGQPPGISTATIRLVAQRSAPPATDATVPVVVQSDVVTVSPTGRVTARHDGLLLNVLMIRTENGWRASAILGQAG